MVKVCCLGKSERKPRARLKFYVRPEIFLPNNPTLSLSISGRVTRAKNRCFFRVLEQILLFIIEQLGWIICIVSFCIISKYGLFFMIFFPVHVGLLWGCILSVWNIVIS